MPMKHDVMWCLPQLFTGVFFDQKPNKNSWFSWPPGIFWSDFFLSPQKKGVTKNVAPDPPTHLQDRLQPNHFRFSGDYYSKSFTNPNPTILKRSSWGIISRRPLWGKEKKGKEKKIKEKKRKKRNEKKRKKRKNGSISIPFKQKSKTFRWYTIKNCKLKYPGVGATFTVTVWSPWPRQRCRGQTRRCHIEVDDGSRCYWHWVPIWDHKIDPKKKKYHFLESNTILSTPKVLKNPFLKKKKYAGSFCEDSGNMEIETRLFCESFCVTEVLSVTLYGQNKPEVLSWWKGPILCKNHFNEKTSIGKNHHRKKSTVAHPRWNCRVWPMLGWARLAGLLSSSPPLLIKGELINATQNWKSVKRGRCSMTRFVFPKVSFENAMHLRIMFLQWWELSSAKQCTAVRRAAERNTKEKNPRGSKLKTKIPIPLQ